MKFKSSFLIAFVLFKGVITVLLTCVFLFGCNAVQTVNESKKN